MKRILFRNFRIIDETADFRGDLAVEDGLIVEAASLGYQAVIDAGQFPRGAVLMPAFIDLHAHFRDPGYPQKETLESGCLAAAAGGYGTAVCMANTNPPLDAAAGVLALKKRADALGLLDLYPAMALTRGMAGETLSEIAAADLPAAIRLFSEDGKDVACDALLLAAFKEAGRLGIPVSCHCDAGGAEAEQAKRAGEPRSAWSRIEENRGIQRCIALGRSAGGHIHIAHVSTKESAAMIRKAKAERTPGFVLTCEATPHHLVFTEADADRLGPESAGRVNPPLRAEADRQALIAAVLDGTADAIATDHAPHTEADKSLGSPGFTGLETAFGLCLTELVRADRLGLSRLSALMSAAPARLLGLRDRGRIAPGLRADLVIADCGALWQVQPETFKSRGKNSPASGLSLRGKVLMTIQQGRIVWEA